MGSSENFSLRWNDFESNISSSFRELRQRSELFDVTLCCDNGTDLVQAHKVILAACSPLFRTILAQNRDQRNMFLYLKGVHHRELISVLDFMYNGEVSISQDSLNNFLSAAEELAVKGLTSTDGNLFDPPDDEDEIVLKPKRSFSTRKSTKRPIAKKDLSEEEHQETELKRIKAEPESEITREVEDSEDVFNNEEEEEEYEPFTNFDLDDTTAANTPTTKPAGRGAANNPETKVVCEEARFSRTKQGNALLIDKAGYCYLINRKSERKIYWKCQRKSAKSCRSNCQTEGFYITRKTAEHTHPPYPPPRNKYTEDY